MIGTTLAVAALQTSEYFGSGSDPRRLGSAHPRNAPYQAFLARDGYFVVAAGNDDLFRRACEGIGCAQLAADPRFATTVLRARHQEALKDLLEREFARLSTEECLAIMRRQGVPCAAINSYSQALADPQVEHYRWVQPMVLPGGAQSKTFVSPLGIGQTLRRMPPALGEHTDEIRREFER